MRKGLFLFFVYSLIESVSLGADKPLPVPTSETGVALSDTQWKSALTQFESSVSDLADILDSNQNQREKIEGEIQELEKKATDLRRDTQKGTNVIGEIRLKGLLNDLKEKLELNSVLQHQADEKQKEFEQKALSLIALYNDRIEKELETTDTSTKDASLDAKLKNLSELIQKRNHTQTLLKQYEKKDDKSRTETLPELGPLKANDRENLQLALDLLRDRKRDLQERLEKCSLEEDEVKNELKLQGKMQEFLEGIQRMNEDSEFPRESLRRSDLGGNVEKKKKNKMENRLNELRVMIGEGKKTLIQVEELMRHVQHQLDTISARKK